MKLSNLAARVGAWAAANPKDALWGWAVFVAVCVALGAAAGARTISETKSTSGDSARADRILSRAGLQKSAEEVVLVQNPRLATPNLDLLGRKNTTREVYKATAQLVKRLQAKDNVKDLRDPLAPWNGDLRSWDLRSTLVTFRVDGRPEDASKKVGPMLAAVAAVQEAYPRLIVSEFGEASSGHALDKTVGRDFKRAEFTTVPVTLAILLLAFGAVVAAGLPVLLAFTGVLAAVGLTTAASRFFPITRDTTSVILLVGMAVGIDYSLFYLRREREERAKGLSRPQALLRTAATSGHAVLISGLTVLIAMSGMFFSGSRIFTSFAVGTILMVAVALIGALTVLPALISKLGDRIDKGRAPFRTRDPNRALEPRFWSYVTTRVLRRPLLAAAVSASALLLLSVPALKLHTQFPGYTDLPASLGFTETRDRIQIAFGLPQYVGEQTPAVIAVRADNVRKREVQSSIAAMERLALSSRQMTGPVRVHWNKRKTVAAVSLSLKGNGNDADSKAALALLRDRIIPETVGRTPGVTAALVTGTTASTTDFNTTMRRHMPIVFGFALSLVFVLLLITFRSIVIPIKMVLLNLLSVGAAYGILVAIFQYHWAEPILGFHSNGAIVSWLPMFLFVILFGVSMDYHVFILSRIKELVDGGMPTERAVAVGIKRTASTVTSAAAVMVAVFAIFASLNVLEMKQMGVGLGVAILIDATIVRAVLLPASMKLLGDWNWYLPHWLEWLPRLRGEREAVPRVAEAPALDPA